MFSTVSPFFIHFFIFVASCRIQLSCVFIVHCFILCQSLLPPANEIWSKVMFLRLCHSVHRRVCLQRGVYLQGGLHLVGVSLKRVGVSASRRGCSASGWGVVCIQGVGFIENFNSILLYQCFFLSGCLDCFPVGIPC